MSPVVLITGATDGLGRALAHELADRGATLLLHGRDDRRGEATLDEIRTRNGRDLHWYRADLASLGEVRQLGERVAAEWKRLDVLVSNAGIGTRTRGERREESADGHELRFAVNYLAGFLLTGILQETLIRSAPARIVNVSSAGQAAIDFDDVMLERSYSGFQAYCQSKLAQVMHTFDLAEELAGAGVTANCLHPGTLMPTKMVIEAGRRPVTPLEDGVRAVRRLAVDADLEAVTGRYFDGERESAAHPQAYDPDARRRLRELSLSLLPVRR
jgi:NAD(P)-dependent dehydrogenase (short-subunit alcohol dehydrogenase family)